MTASKTGISPVNEVRYLPKSGPDGSRRHKSIDWIQGLLETMHVLFAGTACPVLGK